jgi:hypothetical protein
MEVEDFVDRLGTLGDDLVAHLGHARLRRLSYKDWSHRKLSDISFSQVFYSCASAQPRCQAVLLVSSFGLPARPASTPRSWSSISSSVSSWAPKGTLSSIRSSSGSFVGFLFALSIANFFYLVAAAAVLPHGRVAAAISVMRSAGSSLPSGRRLRHSFQGRLWRVPLLHHRSRCFRDLRGRAVLGDGWR